MQHSYQSLRRARWGANPSMLPANFDTKLVDPTDTISNEGCGLGVLM